MLLSSRTPAQTSNILLIGTLRTFAHMKKLFLIYALISPNPENVHTCQEGRLSRRVTWFVTHLQGIRLASAKLGTALLQARALG